MREHLADTELVADEIALNGGPAPGLLESLLRRQVGAVDIVVATDGGRVIAVGKGCSTEVVPEEVPGEALLQARQGTRFVSLEPQKDGGYLIRTAVPLGSTGPGGDRLVVQAVYPVAERLGALADTVQAAYQQFGGRTTAQTAEGQLHTDPDRRAAAVAAGGVVRRDLHAQKLVQPIRTWSRVRGRWPRATSTRGCRSPRTTKWASGPSFND